MGAQAAELARCADVTRIAQQAGQIGVFVDTAAAIASGIAPADLRQLVLDDAEFAAAEPAPFQLPCAT